MNMRLKKVLDDIQKTENKILELQEHVRQLRIQKKQMEFRTEQLPCSLMKRAIFLWIVLKQV